MEGRTVAKIVSVKHWKESGIPQIEKLIVRILGTEEINMLTNLLNPKKEKGALGNLVVTTYMATKQTEW